MHRSPIDRHETRFALQMLRDQIQQRVYPVHRLDKPTSGLLVFGLSSEVARVLAEQFSQRTIDKCYLAVVRGYCPEQGEITHALRAKHDVYSDRRGAVEKTAQEALTTYRRLACVEWPEAVDRYPQTRYSLVELRPHTGRKHQLRRHMKHIGHPIIGDADHGKGVHNRFFAKRFACSRLLLACTKLSFDHPVSGQRLTLEASLGDEFLRVVEAFEWKGPASNI
ncbi:MAG: tRNA pseudouridine(65) synthase TruC [Congregibacter sp.]